MHLIGLPQAYGSLVLHAYVHTLCCWQASTGLLALTKCSPWHSSAAPSRSHAPRISVSQLPTRLHVRVSLPATAAASLQAAQCGRRLFTGPCCRSARRRKPSWPTMTLMTGAHPGQPTVRCSVWIMSDSLLRFPPCRLRSQAAMMSQVCLAILEMASRHGSSGSGAGIEGRNGGSLSAPSAVAGPEMASILKHSSPACA